MLGNLSLTNFFKIVRGPGFPLVARACKNKHVRYETMRFVYNLNIERPSRRPSGINPSAQPLRHNSVGVWLSWADANDLNPQSPTCVAYCVVGTTIKKQLSPKVRGDLRG